MYEMYCTESVYIILQFNGNFPFYNKLSLSATYHELKLCSKFSVRLSFYEA